MPRTVLVVKRTNAAGQPVLELHLHTKSRDGREYSEVLAFATKEQLVSELRSAIEQAEQL
jgi:hypothetical protein